MKLHFASFDVEAGADKVQVYDGDNASAPLLHTFTGSRSMHMSMHMSQRMYRRYGISRVTDVFSSGNTMFVSFVSDVSDTMDGFKIVYSTVNPGKAQSFLCKSIDLKQWYLTFLQLLPFIRIID